MPAAELKSSLANFVTFASSLKGDEKSEAQLFLDHFFRALGHGGVQEAGATLEFRIAKKPGSAQLELIKGEPGAKAKGGKKFADLLWPDRVLIEMKSRGEHLEKHYDQTFNYWTHIVPKRPPYVILCNFDQFWIYDFNTQLFDPVDRVALRDLAEHWSAFGFLLPEPRVPVFDNNRVAVTRKAADSLAHVFKDIVFRGIARDRAQRFILQLLVALVSEDIGLLPETIVTQTLKDCVEGQSSYDLLGGLFRQMNSQQRAEGGRFQNVDYFNGGLFAVIDPIELKHAELYALHDAARHNDWSKVKPEIFGTLFQESMDAEERHAFGAHFTSEFDIQKVVGPTIVRPWRERIKTAGTLGGLRTLLTELRRFRVLDPACGSGNFLYVAYREMKRLERELLVRLRDKGEKADRLVSAIVLSQFFGIDVVPFAVELARVTLMLAKELELAEAKKTEEADGLLVFEKPLPLDNLERQIVCADALFTDWPKADAIIGNPPYLGSRHIATEHGPDYTRRLYARFPNVPKMADFCTHWFRLAHDALPQGCRAGLVGTNTIRQNEGREASLDYIVTNGGTIAEAVSTEVWSGEAAVHVSIVNWIKGDAPGEKLLMFQRGDSAESPWETFKQDYINSSLSHGLDVSHAVVLRVNKRPKRCFQGQKPNHEGFFLMPDEAAEMLRKHPNHRDILFPYMDGTDLVEGHGPSRWVIDFGERDQFAARIYAAAFERVRDRVMPDIVKKAAAERASTGKDRGPWARMAERWWIHERHRPECLAAIATMSRYIAVSRTTKRPIFDFVSSAIHPDTRLVGITFPDDYSFGIVQSSLHWTWLLARCTTLKADPNYNEDSVFGTFPWPQSPTREQIAEVAAAAVALRVLRREIMGKLKCSLRELYRILEEPGANPLRDAHTRLDTAVRTAYAMGSSTHSSTTLPTDPLAFLLALNLSLAAKEKAGESITPPGLPVSEAERTTFITDDCINLAEPI